jgi:hypothetical protein
MLQKETVSHEIKKKPVKKCFGYHKLFALILVISDRRDDAATSPTAL